MAHESLINIGTTTLDLTPNVSSAYFSSSLHLPVAQHFNSSLPIKNFDFGIFPFPNQTGDSKLIFEPNITIMTSANTEHQDAVDDFLDLMSSDKDLAVEILDYTKTASMLKDVTPTFNNPSQEDIDKYASEDMIVDVTLGNNQLVWGGFQEENAKDIAAWLQGQESLEDCLKACDGRVDSSSAN